MIDYRDTMTAYGRPFARDPHGSIPRYVRRGGVWYAVARPSARWFAPHCTERVIIYERHHADGRIDYRIDYERRVFATHAAAVARALWLARGLAVHVRTVREDVEAPVERKPTDVNYTKPFPWYFSPQGLIVWNTTE